MTVNMTWCKRPTYNITEGTYPGGATANEKRVIRKKAKKFAVRNGELVYKKVLRGRKVLQLRRLQSRVQCCALKY